MLTLTMMLLGGGLAMFVSMIRIAASETDALETPAAHGRATRDLATTTFLVDAGTARRLDTPLSVVEISHGQFGLDRRLNRGATLECAR